MATKRTLLVVVGLVFGICHSTRAAPPDVDECLENNGGCNPGETCVNTPGSFTCAYRNGVSTLPGYVCFDINECLTNNGGCSEEATCENTPGSFTCTCRAGYTGDGLNCSDINECLINNGGCSPDATCTNTPGSFTCSCKHGFNGDGFTCTDIDECLSNNGGCNSLATCYNTDGSFTCTCNIGYYGNGFSCYDYNECLSNNGGCSRYATCTNTIGSSYCTCTPEYTGNGYNCSVYVSTIAPTTEETTFIPAVSECIQGSLLRLNDASGTITSMNYPNQYINNANCQWIITASSPYNVVRLRFSAFCLEQTHDTVRVYDGSSSSNRQLLLATGCSAVLPSQVTTTQRYMFIHFATDHSVTNTGFSANYNLQ